MSYDRVIVEVQYRLGPLGRTNCGFSTIRLHDLVPLGLNALGTIYEKKLYC